MLSALVCFSYFSDRVMQIFPEPISDFATPTYSSHRAGITSVQPQLDYLLRNSLSTFLFCRP
jgi:hypothetical protein